MERDFYNEDIEQLLKQKADQYKMYPSDKVWKGIHRVLHPRRKWYWLGFVLFLGGISYYTVHEMTAPAKKSTIAEAKNNSTENNSPDQSEKKAVIIPFVTTGKQQPAKEANSGKRHIGPYTDSQPSDNDLSVVTIDTYITETNSASPSREARLYDFRTGKLKEELVAAVSADRIAKAEETETAQALTINEPTAPTAGIDFKNLELFAENEDSKRIGYLQQNAMYELVVPKPQRLSWQLSFSPTMNYRKLTGNEYTRVHSDVKNIPIAQDIVGGPDELVRHKPALGLEIGSHFIYQLNKTFSVKAGLQFNYARYDIQAYSSYLTERATIALNTNSRRSGDSLTSYTNLRNFGGDATQELHNVYLQFSMPVGIEWRLLGNDKLQLGVAGTVAPTYLINRNTYLITTDFKNYTQEPSLLRRWNVNGAAEAFIAYKTGTLKWQVGPQFRYQLMSSYKKEYPIAEHLMEFGIKIGVAKTIR
jgi:hypothetical protein